MEDNVKTCHFIKNGYNEPSELVFDDRGIINDFFKNLTSKFLQDYIRLWNHDNLKRLILTHTDSDGHGSGALVYKAQKADHLNTQLYNIGYTFDLTQIEDKIKEADLIFITDLSLTQEQITYIEDTATGKVVWIDHHDSSKKIKVKDNNKFYSFIHAEIGMSAAGLVWLFLVFTTAIQEWLFGGELDDTTINADNVNVEEIKRRDVIDNYAISTVKNRGKDRSEDRRVVRFPNIIKMICLYDTFDDNMDRRFSYGFSFYDFNINSDEGKKFWDTLLGDIAHNMYEPCGQELLDELIEKGGIVKTYCDNDYARIRKSQLFKFDVELEIKSGVSIRRELHSVAAMNINGFSMAFGPEIDEVDACIRYFQKKDGTFEYGIYSSKIRPTAINCMQFASHFGGGGHLHAAGWNSVGNDVIPMLRHYTKFGRPVVIRITEQDKKNVQ